MEQPFAELVIHFNRLQQWPKYMIYIFVLSFAAFCCFAGVVSVCFLYFVSFGRNFFLLLSTSSSVICIDAACRPAYGFVCENFFPIPCGH